MTISLKHSFTNPKADGADATITRPSEWNAEHVLTMATGFMLGRTTAGAGAVEELSATTVRTFLNVENGADVTDAVNVGTAINGATAKVTPIDADTIALIDSAASNVLKKVTWANVKATLKTYFDTLYAGLASANVFTANQTIGNASSAAQLFINGAVGTVSDLIFRAGGLDRWIIRRTNTAESGSNVGSDLILNNYNDAGTLLSTVLTVARATGAVDFNVVPTISGSPVRRLVQRVSTLFSTQTSTATVIPFDNTTPQNTEGAEAFTVSITPTKTTNKLIVRALLHLGTDASGAAAIAALFKDTEASARATGFWVLVGDLVGVVEVIYEMTAGSTSAMTFKIRYGANAGTCFINRTSGALVFNATVNSYIEVTEYEV